MRFSCFLATILGLLIVASLPAQEPLPQTGFEEDGYVYKRSEDGNGGFWWRGGKAFLRTKIVTPGSTYYYCGRQYQNQATYYWSYSLAPVVTVIKEKAAYPTPPAYSKDWKSDVLDYAAKRDDLQAYENALYALGFHGQSFNFQQSSYGGFAGNGLGLGSYGTTGNSLYGYSYKTALSAYSDPYGSLDLNILYQQAARNAQSAQQYGADATANHLGLVDRAGSAQARVATIIAEARAMEIKARALQPAPQTTLTTQGSSFQSGSSSGTGPLMPPAVSDNQAVQDAKAFLQNTAMPLCGSCHSGNEPKGGFNILSWPQLTSKQKISVINRLFPEAGEKQMPRKPDGTVGTPLSEAQIEAFRRN